MRNDTDPIVYFSSTLGETVFPDKAILWLESGKKVWAIFLKMGSSENEYATTVVKEQVKKIIKKTNRWTIYTRMGTVKLLKNERNSY